MTSSTIRSDANLRSADRGPVAVFLFLAAALLHLVGVGGEPLRDWDEGTVAQVSREIAARGWAGIWQPTLWGEPYVNKPPLVHGLVALSTQAFGEAEWAIRLPPALLSSASIPAFYLLARDLFARPRPALWSALALLTLLPVARHGRLAMLDGALVLFGILFLVCLGRAGRSGVWALAAGLALSGAALTKGAAFGVFVLVGLCWIGLTAPGLLARAKLWLLGTLGLFPAVLWYAVQVLRDGGVYAEAALTNQVLIRIAETEAQNGGPPYYYLIELLEGGWPWLLLLPAGLLLGWRERGQPWPALALPWFFGYLLLISALPGKLPWYIHPLFPAFALICGRGVEALLEGPHLPRPGWVLRSLWPLALGAALGAALFSPVGPDPNLALLLGCLALALSWGWAAFHLRPADPRIPTALAAGTYLALLGLGLSGRAIWELSEDYPVAEVAQAVAAEAPPGAVVLTTHGYGRPSLDFYAGRPIHPAPAASLLSEEAPEAYWLATPEEARQVPHRERLAEVAGQVLLGPAVP